MLSEAIAFAAEAHRLQRDKNGQPYILHPLRVMYAVLEKGLPETYAVVAVLHDTVEDTEVNLEEIEGRFGSVVRQGVDAVSRRRDPDTGEWSETHAEYIDRCLQDPIGLEVKECDTYDNMNPKRFHPAVPYGRYIKVLQKITTIRENCSGENKPAS